MTTKFNRVLFDYDGTLIVYDKENENRRIAESLNLPDEKFWLFDLRLTHFFATSYGKQYYKNKKMSKDLFYYAIDKIIMPSEFNITAKQLADAIKEISKYTSTVEKTAVETLEYLSMKGYQLCIFTNGFRDDQVAHIKHHGLYDYFERIYAWDDFYAKPDKRALIRALAGTDPKQNVMVGDSLTNDIIPAKKMGVYTFGINMSYNSDNDEEPDRYIKTLADIKGIL